MNFKVIILIYSLKWTILDKIKILKTNKYWKSRFVCVIYLFIYLQNWTPPPKKKTGCAKTVPLLIIATNFNETSMALDTHRKWLFSLIIDIKVS